VISLNTETQWTVAHSEKINKSNFSDGGNVDRVELLLDKRVGVSAGDGVGNAALMNDAGAGCRDEPFRRNRENTA
jgi:hypothetical protein